MVFSENNSHLQSGWLDFTLKGRHQKNKVCELPSSRPSPQAIAPEDNQISLQVVHEKSLKGQVFLQRCALDTGIGFYGLLVEIMAMQIINNDSRKHLYRE